jgi:hypothetical protein
VGHRFRDIALVKYNSRDVAKISVLGETTRKNSRIIRSDTGDMAMVRSVGGALGRWCARSVLWS